MNKQRYLRRKGEPDSIMELSPVLKEINILRYKIKEVPGDLSTISYPAKELKKSLELNVV